MGHTHIFILNIILHLLATFDMLIEASDFILDAFTLHGVREVE